MKKYPWPQTQPGESFFVPALDTDKAVLEGRQAAAHYDVRGYSYKVCVYKGILGVMFRKPSARRTPP